MLQQNPLLHYRIEDKSEFNSEHAAQFYNLKSGLWEDSDGNPIIITYLQYQNGQRLAGTTITETREAIDQSEGSSGLFCGTEITKTREGIDQSETSAYAFGKTEVTATRESIDQSEGSYESIS